MFHHIAGGEQQAGTVQAEALSEVVTCIEYGSPIWILPHISSLSRPLSSAFSNKKVLTSNLSTTRTKVLSTWRREARLYRRACFRGHAGVSRLERDKTAVRPVAVFVLVYGGALDPRRQARRYPGHQGTSDLLRPGVARNVATVPASRRRHRSRTRQRQDCSSTTPLWGQGLHGEERRRFDHPEHGGRLLGPRDESCHRRTPRCRKIASRSYTTSTSE